MNIFGKIIGFFLGYMLLGPIGGLLGLFIGHMFDKGLSLHTIPRQRPAAVQQAFFTATFSVMGHLAKADGHVSPDEIEEAERIMAQLDLSADLKREAIRLFNQGKAPHFEVDAVLKTLFEKCHNHRDLLRFFIEIQLGAALSDGALQPEEKDVLLHICQQLQFSPQEFEHLWAQQWASQAFHQWYNAGFNQHARAAGGTYNRAYGQQQRSYSSGYARGARQSASGISLQDAYGVLGISPSASVTDIKKAYRKLMNQHHPDKLASRGLPEGMMKMAKEKVLQIRSAYDLIRESRGFK
jgi:DnaJ like chaperone protein